MLTDGKTTSPTLLLLKVTKVETIAALLRFTVQVLVPAPMNDVAPHTSDVILGGGGVKIMVAVCDIPLKIAVIVAVVLDDPLLVAVNWALVLLAATLTDTGTVSAAVLLTRPIVVEVLIAPLSVTEQLLTAGPTRDVGLHNKLVRVEAVLTGVTVAPIPATLTLPPAADAASAFATVTLVVCDAAILMTATTPSLIVEVFIPYATQV